MRPFGILAVRGGSSRMIESAVTDFPEPDSPTMATTSPRLTVKLTPSTARTMPRVVMNWVWRSSTSSSGAVVSGRVPDRPRKSSPASTVLKTSPLLRRRPVHGMRRPTFPPPDHNAGARENVQASVLTNAALRSPAQIGEHCPFVICMAPAIIILWFLRQIATWLPEHPIGEAIGPAMNTSFFGELLQTI